MQQLCGGHFRHQAQIFVSSPNSGKTGNAVPEVDCTPRTKKKVEHFRQGLAARRIQRTWKHFYEELEERKDVKSELPATLVQGT